jgi:hypothetical protein
MTFETHHLLAISQNIVSRFKQVGQTTLVASAHLALTKTHLRLRTSIFRFRVDRRSQETVVGIAGARLTEIGMLKSKCGDKEQVAVQS